MISLTTTTTKTTTNSRSSSCLVLVLVTVLLTVATSPSAQASISSTKDELPQKENAFYYANMLKDGDHSKQQPVRRELSPQDDTATASETNSESATSSTGPFDNNRVYEDLASRMSSTHQQQQQQNSQNILQHFHTLKKDLFLIVVSGFVLAGVVAVVAAGTCWYTVNRSRGGNASLDFIEAAKHKIARDGSMKSSGSAGSGGDRRLAQSAQMYHYQHQRQQIIAMEKAKNDSKREDESENSDAEGEEGDYTVYECPGLAPTGEMQVTNPLFKEEFSASSQSIYQQPPTYLSVTAGGNDNSSTLNTTVTTSPAPTASSSTTELLGNSSSSSSSDNVVKTPLNQSTPTTNQ